jgi:hypothetical protein
MFDSAPGCFLEGLNSVVYDSGVSFESCAASCLVDSCCLSFETGQGSKAGSCSLSYQDNLTKPEAWVCDNTKNISFYRRRFIVPLRFDQPFSAVSDQAGFTQLLSTAVLAQAGGLVRPADLISTTVFPSANTSTLLATMVVANAFIRQQIKSSLPVSVQQDAVTYTGVEDGQRTRCPPGTVSSSGLQPGCSTCRANTYSNRAQTTCKVCPEGTNSSAGSDSVDDCIKPPTAGRNPFTVGDDWMGTYANGNDIGGLTITVSRTTPTSARLLISQKHGGDCNPSLGCRNPGVSEFYATAQVDATGVNATLLATDWAAITDQSYSGIIRSGNMVFVANGNSVQLSGTYSQGQGTFVATRRCTAADEKGSFSNGDTWVGTYTCARTSNDTQKVVSGLTTTRALTLDIESIDRDGNVVATVDIAHAQGISQYEVVGTLTQQSDCRAFELTPTRWLTRYPAGLVARALSGRLTDDGEFYFGSFELSEQCACTGVTPASDPMGATCGADNWCYVSAACPQAQPAAASGFFVANCSGFESCPDFSLARVCSVADTLCKPRWSPFGNR